MCETRILIIIMADICAWHESSPKQLEVTNFIPFYRGGKYYLERLSSLYKVIELKNCMRLTSFYLNP